MRISRRIEQHIALGMRAAMPVFLAALFAGSLAAFAGAAAPDDDHPGEPAPCAGVDQRAPLSCIRHSGAEFVLGTPIEGKPPYDFRRPDVRVVDLSKVLPPALGKITRRGNAFFPAASTFELFQGDVRFHPARWPKAGFDRFLTPAAGGDEVVLPVDAYRRWGREPFLWIGGYWKFDWAYETSPVVSRNDAAHSLVVEKIHHEAPIRYRFPSFFLNAFGALTEPGEYVLDPVARKAYVIPVNDSNVFELAVQETAITLDGARDVTLKDVHIEKMLGTAIRIRNSYNIVIDGCTIRHVGTAIDVDGGGSVSITNCLIEDTAETAVRLAGGDRQTLTAAGHRIANSTIRGFGVDSHAYRTAIQISGVGIVAENNTISDAPHSAIMVQGNDHVIRGNRIFNVVREADDAGAIYMGRDWTERGTLIEGNLLQDIGMPDAPDAANAVGRGFVSGIYLDDQESGFRISRNVFDRVSRPIVVHGGRDNEITGNAFLRCQYSGIWLGRRGEGLTGGTLEQRLAAMPFQGELWARRYPALATIRQDRPADPINNVEQDNIAVGCRLFSLRTDNTSPDFWPNVGAGSKVYMSPPFTGTALDLLRRASLDCKQYPILCPR